MKNMITVTLLSLVPISSAYAQTQPGAELAKAKNCLACHAPAIKLVGPALRDIAAKYGGDKGAETAMALKIRNGSNGVWGAIPMPANTQVNEAEAKTLAQWVLAQK